MLEEFREKLRRTLRRETPSPDNSANNKLAKSPEPGRLQLMAARVRSRLQTIRLSTNGQNKVQETDETDPQAIQTLLDRLPNEDVEKIDKNLSGRRLDRIQQLFQKFSRNAKPEDAQKVDKNLDKMNRGIVHKIWPNVQMLAQMARDPKVAWASKALAIGALVYLISPLDAVPDVIPVAGLTDDVALIITVISALARDLEKYQNQAAQSNTDAAANGTATSLPKTAKTSDADKTSSSAKPASDKNSLKRSITEFAKRGVVGVAEDLADVEIKKHNRIVRITLLGSIAAAALGIIFELIVNQL